MEPQAFDSDSPPTSAAPRCSLELIKGKCSATNRLIPAKEHGAVQLNVAQAHHRGIGRPARRARLVEHVWNADKTRFLWEATFVCGESAPFLG